MKWNLLIFSLFIPLLFVYSQNNEQKSIHQVQSEIYAKYNYNNEQEFDKMNPHTYAPQSDLPLPGKHVFGWNPYWVGTAYTGYNYNLLTTVGYFSYDVDTATGGYTTFHSWRTTNLIPLAHSFGTKVVLTVTNFGSAQNTAILGNAQKRQRLIDSIISLVQFRQADGVNIDFEIVSSSQTANLVTFMTALSQQMHDAVPGSKVSIDLPAVDWNNSFYTGALNNVCDYMIVMGYDYHYSGSSNSGPCSPLQSGGFWGAYNVTNSVNYYLSNGASANKLLLGVPYYGYDWPTTTGNINSTTTGTGTAYVYSTMKTNSLAYGRLWDSYSLTPWFHYQPSGWRQGWYDDSVSLGLKYDLVNSSNLAGIGIWALSYDGSNNELWNLIAAKFGIIGITPTTNEIPKDFNLFQNFPNPFNPTTKIKFSIPELIPPEFTRLGGKGGRSTTLRGGRLVEGMTRLIVYDILGREVTTLVNQQLKPGTYEVAWPAPSGNASNYPSGVYFYHISYGNFSDSRKMILLR